MSEPWVKKYSPKSIAELVGQGKTVQEIKLFVDTFPNVKKKALILYGPSGVGKTCIAKALASEFDFELVELNASDFRDAKSITNILGSASKQMSLFGSKKIILVDDVDGISGQQDRGGVAAIIDVIAETKFPILLTANDVYIDKLKTLRSYCQLVELRGITQVSILNKLKEICQRETLVYEETALQKIASSADGDLRAAINDLQIFAQDGSIAEEKLALWGREKEESIFNLMKLIFKSYDSTSMLNVFDYVDEDLARIILWLDQNVPAEYSKQEEFAFAYNNLADADRFLSRIIRRQHWRFFVYAKLLALVGVQQAKTEINRKFVSHQRPDILLKLFIRSAKLKKIRSLVETSGNKMHASARDLQQSFWPYFKFIEEKNPKYAEGIAEGLGLES